MPNDVRVRELVEQIQKTSRSPEEVCQACPELLPLVRQHLQQGQLNAAPAPSTLTAPGQADSAASGQPDANPDPYPTASDGNTSSLPPGTAAELSSASRTVEEFHDLLLPPQGPGELGRLGPYRVLQVLGRGGMGVVFRGEDTQLQRPVALKVMLPRLASSQSAKQRFLREARAAAALKHDHIVTIHQVGEERGAPFLAMEFLEGEPLDQRLKREGRLPLRDVLRIGRELAEGLETAHEHGLVHRDIKPGNIWLEASHGRKSVESRVKILDFGLARPAEQDEMHLTQSGAIVGTPSYMAPEQAQGQHVGPASDLFSLGVVLYRLCTGRLPFQAENTTALLIALVTQEPRPPLAVNPDVPAPLSELIVQLLAKDPARRPSSAAVVADRLQSLEHELRTSTAAEATASVSLPPGVTGDVQQRPRRRRWLLLGSALAGVVGLVVLGQIVLRLYDEKGKQIGEVKLPDNVKQVGVQPPGAKEVKVGTDPGKNGPPVGVWEPGPAEDILPGIVPRPAKLPGLGRWQVVTASPRGSIWSVAWSPDGKWIACGGSDGLVRILDAKSLQPVRVLLGHSQEVKSVAWRHDNHWLASASNDQTVRLWQVDGTPGPVLKGHVGRVHRVAWSPDGERLASAGEDKTVRLWHAVGTAGPVLRGHGNPVGYVAWRPDGKALASGEYSYVEGDNVIRLWQADGAPGPVLKGHKKSVHSVSWSPDDSRLASASEDGTVRLWAADGTPEKILIEGKESRRIVAWSPDGKYLAVGGRILGELWTVTGERGPVLLVRAYPVNSLAWSPDSRQLVSGHWEGQVRRWNVDGRPEGVLGRQPMQINALAWSPDGTRLVLGSAREGSISTLTADGKLTWITPMGSASGVAWSPDGKWIASSGQDYDSRLWREDGAKGPVLKGATSNHIAWSPDSKTMATAGRDTTVRLWGVDGTPGIVVKGHTKEVCKVAWSPDGQWLASAGEDDTVRLWKPDGTAGPVLASSAGRSLAWSPDSKRFAWGSAGGAVNICTATGAPMRALGGHAEKVLGLSWSPDGKRLVSGSDDHTIRLWSAEGHPGPVLRGHTGQVTAVAWAGQGNRIASSSWDGTLRVWDADTGAPLWSAALVNGPALLTFKGPALLTFSPGGQLLHGEPNVAESELFYVVEDAKGRQETLRPSEFFKRTGHTLPK